MAERKDVFTVVEDPKDQSKAYWNRIGNAFVNRDGSLKVRLNALPVNGELVIRDPKPAVGAATQDS